MGEADEGFDKGDEGASPLEDKGDEGASPLEDKGDAGASPVEDKGAAGEDPALIGGDNETSPKKFTGKGIIPIERHQAVLDKERTARAAAESRLAALEREVGDRGREREAQKAVAEMETRADELSAAYASALIEGNTEGAAKLQREMRKIDREIARMELSGENERRTAQMLENSRVEMVIARLEAEHPVFNPDSEQFDETIASFAISEQQRLMRSEGLTPSKALAKAAANVVARFVSPREGEGPRTGLGASQDRVKAAVSRNYDAARRQPPSMKGVGMDSDKLGSKALGNVAAMSADEFSTLPEATRARLRGDFL
jgi:hypothetical protein